MKKSTKQQMNKLITGQQRNSMKEQGFFDGRFVERSVKIKKLYLRKVKHKAEQNGLKFM